MPNKILILDDSNDILDVMKETLEMENYEVATMTQTDDICKAALDTQADLVMLDYILSGINGGELCHQLKTNPQTSHIPVVLVSAHPRVLESLGNYGSDAIIAKPFDITELTDTVSHCLHKAKRNIKVA